MKAVVAILVLAVLSFSSGAPQTPQPRHHFTPIPGHEGVLALREDGMECKTVDLGCNTVTWDVVGKAGGTSCALLAALPLCMQLAEDQLSHE